MPIVKDQIQILRVHEQSNSSQIVVALGRRLGQFRVMAKGVRRWPKKGFEGGFDLLTRGEMLAYPRPDEHLWIFKEWDEQARPALGQSYKMLAAASYLCELTESLTRMTAGNSDAGPEHDASAARLFDLLAASAGALSERVVDPGFLLLNFTLNALANEGILPDLERCQNCNAAFFGTQKKSPLPQTPARAWISYDGLECLKCFQERAADRHVRGAWLGPEALKALLHLQRTLKPLKLTPAASAQLASALALLVHGAIERDLRTLPFAMSLLRRRV